MINFIITKTGVVVVDGTHLVNGLTNMAGAEAKYGLYQLDNLAPAAKTYTDADTWTGVAKSLDAGNLNDTVKQVLGSIFGGLVGAGFFVLSGSPAVGLAFDILAGKGFEASYDWVSKTTSDWEGLQDFLTPIFDAINALSNIGEWQKHINALVDTFFRSAGLFTQPRRDPLTLDLDGDGLETVGTTAGILFDHNADGIKTGTGWVIADDGFLVLDKNGNGVIDSGRELFGDNFIKANGQLAADGFDALRSLDSNANGKIDSGDAQLGIASINTGSTANSQVLPNGNQIADLSTYTKIDGTTGSTVEVTGNLADINLGTDSFHRQFTGPSTPLRAGRPDMLVCPERSRRVSGAANDYLWRMAA
jgi:hypothetical protein